MQNILTHARRNAKNGISFSDENAYIKYVCMFVHLSDSSVKNLFVPENNWWWNNKLLLHGPAGQNGDDTTESNYFQTVLNAFEL